MKITRACDYAMRALIYMAGKPAGTLFMRSELARLSNVPDSFLGKIMQNLAKAGILVSERGKKGGFRLEKELDEISMYDVITAVEGDLKITDCLVDESYCEKTGGCNVRKAWHDIQHSLVSQLQAVSLKDLK